MKRTAARTSRWPRVFAPSRRRAWRGAEASEVERDDGETLLDQRECEVAPALLGVLTAVSQDDRSVAATVLGGVHDAAVCRRGRHGLLAPRGSGDASDRRGGQHQPVDA